MSLALGERLVVKLDSIRLAMMGAAVLWLAQQSAGAAQVSSGMGVGLTIAPSDSSSENSKSGPKSVSALVTEAEPANCYTWNAAAISVKRAGFERPRRLQRLSAVYWFEARRRDASYRVAVSIASGKVVKVVPA